MSTEINIPDLKWSAQFKVAPPTRTPQLPGDKILLPPSALEGLLAAAPVVTNERSNNRSQTSTFDPYNPYTFAAERYAREQFAERQQQLPHPLTFRLVNPDNGRIVYAGIREFSAGDDEVTLNPFLKEALGLKDGPILESSKKKRNELFKGGDEVMLDSEEELRDVEENSPRITVHAKQLPKGTYVKLRPLEAGYDPEDWKSLLEQHLRSNFTTLTNGEVMVVPGGRGVGGQREEFRFLVDGFRPEGDGICVVDTDLEVDIEALNDEQARETLRKIAAKAHKAPETQQGSSVGGALDIFNAKEGQVLDGEYVDYEIPSWNRSQGLEVELNTVDGEAELDLLVSPYSSRQQARPREDEFVFGDFASRKTKRIRLQPTNVELEDAEAVWVSVRSYPASSESSQGRPNPFTIRASVYDPKETITSQDLSDTPPNPDEVRCKNCRQWIPQRTLFLHENFCYRNNVLCPQGCGTLFQKRSPAFESHWHCSHNDGFRGDSPASRKKHDEMYHTPQSCPNCSLQFPSMIKLAHHRTTTCPGKLILCQFCHLVVPQEGDPLDPSPEALLSNLTHHELIDGGRTTECHLCDKIVRLRDMSTHLKNHEFERLSRPTPRLCRNVNCGRTLDGVSKGGDTRAGTRMGQGPGNDIGLCSVCYGPLYVSLYDPDGKALRRRVERRYLSQLLTGCSKNWCKNEFCKTGRKNRGIEGSLATKDALPMVKPFLDGLYTGERNMPLHFCADEASQRRRGVAALLAAENGLTGKGGYAEEWCVAALEAEGGDLDKAREWLKNWAPQRTEVV